jgi:ribonucleoside-diphosphate reductase alpha chain
LIDPANKDIRGIMRARELWQRILEARFRTGSPYINFIDEANRQLNPKQREMGLKVHGSNLCNEIHLATSEDRTAVCCLSSVNLEKFDEWVDTDMVYDLIIFLDNVLQAFIDNAPREIQKAIRSAEAERSLGLGAMGFHGYLQSKDIPFEGLSAKIANNRMFRYIKAQATKATQTMARTRGEPDDLIGTGTRNAHLIAVAPNANSSIICGCSASIEPIKSNAYVHRTRAGSHLVKNVYLQRILKGMEKDTPEVWQSIIMNEGSVQHLDFLNSTVKDIYKTAFELDQMWIIEHAADRQQYICQGQSLNLFFPAGSPKSYVNAVHLRAWKSKLKGLYYLRTSAGVQADKIGLKIERNALQDAEECLSCHG